MDQVQRLLRRLTLPRLRQELGQHEVHSFILHMPSFLQLELEALVVPPQLHPIVLLSLPESGRDVEVVGVGVLPKLPGEALVLLVVGEQVLYQELLVNLLHEALVHVDLPGAQDPILCLALGLLMDLLHLIDEASELLFSERLLPDGGLQLTVATAADGAVACGDLSIQVAQEDFVALDQLVICLVQVEVQSVRVHLGHVLVVMRGLRYLRHWLVAEIHLDHGHRSRVLFLFRGDDFGHGVSDGLGGVEGGGQGARHVVVVAVAGAHGHGLGLGRHWGVGRRTARWIVIARVAGRCLTLHLGWIFLRFFLRPALTLGHSLPLTGCRQSRHGYRVVGLAQPLDNVAALAHLLHLLRSPAIQTKSVTIQ